MGLLPEFFLLLGIVVFSAMSLLSFLLDRDIPWFMQWIFQAAGAAGLGLLFVSQGLVNGGSFGRSSTDLTRFWISVGYLVAAVSSVLGLNVYLAVVRRRVALSSAFTGTVSVPISFTSGLFVSSFLGSGGNIGFTSTMLALLVVSGLVISFGVFAFLREASRRFNLKLGSGSSLGPVSIPLEIPGVGLPLNQPSTPEVWEESGRKDEEEQ